MQTKELRVISNVMDKTLTEIDIILTKAQKRYLLCLMGEYVYRLKMEGKMLIDVDLAEMNPDFIGYLTHKFYLQAVDEVPDTVKLTNNAYTFYTGIIQ
jgi:hypothetical protein